MIIPLVILNQGLDMFSRRSFVRRGLALSVIGSTFPRPGLSASTKPKVKSIIFLHQFGGPSQMDTFDLKPNAPDAYRGPLKGISSVVPSLPIGEMLPDMAKVMDRVTIVRSVHHEMKNHNSAAYYSLTGYSPPTDDQRLRDTMDLFPAYGSVVSKFKGAANGLPPFISFPHVIRDGSVTPGQHASFMGKTYDPFFIGQDPNSPDFSLPELVLPAGLNPERISNRKEMMGIIDSETKILEKSFKAKGIQDNYDRAHEMLTSKSIRSAFDISAEPARIRERYGRTTYGQSCLLARRLVEAGATFINVYFAPFIGGCQGGWDTHGFQDKPMYPIMKNYLLPITDKTLPTLILDLEERGLLDSTLIFWAGEFGRTPKINNLSGRDHWPQCYTVLFAGGGVKKGFVYGASDSKGAFPSTDPVRPEDLSATLFHLLGINPATEIKNNFNRPFPISTGRVIDRILA